MTRGILVLLLACVLSECRLGKLDMMGTKRDWTKLRKQRKRLIKGKHHLRNGVVNGIKECPRLDKCLGQRLTGESTNWACVR